MSNNSFVKSAFFARLSEPARTRVILGASVAAIGAFAYLLAQLPPMSFGVSLDMKKGGFGKNAEQARDQIREQLGADALTHKGVSGFLDYDSGSGQLTMQIKDRNGNPKRDASVLAHLSRPGDSRPRTVLLRPNANGSYTAPVSSYGKGRWNVSVTASDPSANTGSDVLFHFERSVTVK